MKLSSGAGSSVRKLQLQGRYTRTDRPGVYTLLRLDSSETGQVREAGTNNLDVVRLSFLRPLRVAVSGVRDDIKCISEEDRKEAERKYKAIEPLMPKRRISKADWEQASKSSEVPIKTLRKWLAAWRLDPRMSTLHRKQRKDSGSLKLDPYVEKIVADYLEALRTNGDLQMTDILEEIEHDIEKERKRTKRKSLKVPSVATLYNRWRAMSEIERAEGRLSKRGADRKYGLVRGGLQDVDHPLAVVQVDHMLLPVIVVDEEYRLPIRRAWITVLIDVFSRMIYGYYVTLEAPGDLSLGLAITQAVLPKTEALKQLPYEASWPINGLPWQIHADNAGEFQGNMLELSASEYKFEITFRKVKQPQYGGYIESYLGTLAGKLRHVPGATRENSKAMEGKDPSENAVLTVAELDQYILNIITQYHNEPHSGLNDMTPLAKFLEGMRGTTGSYPVGELLMPEDPLKFMLDFLPPLERTVQPPGIVIDYIWYMDDALQRWVGAKEPNNVSEARKFIIRMDPRDITRVYFWDPDLRQYIVLPTRNMTRPSMTLWEYNAVRQFLRERGVETIDEDIIFNAREERRRILADARKSTRKTRALELQRIRDAEKAAKTLLARAAGHATAQDAERPMTEGSQAPDIEAMSDAVAKPYSMSWDD